MDKFTAHIATLLVVLGILLYALFSQSSTLASILTHASAMMLDPWILVGGIALGASTKRQSSVFLGALAIGVLVSAIHTNTDPQPMAVETMAMRAVSTLVLAQAANATRLLLSR